MDNNPSEDLVYSLTPAVNGECGKSQEESLGSLAERRRAKILPREAQAGKASRNMRVFLGRESNDGVLIWKW